MEGTGSDEEDVVRLDRAVFRIDRGPFDDRQDIALYAFTGNVRPVRVAFFSNLIEFIDEDDARFFRRFNGLVDDDVHVQAFFQFFFFEDVSGLGDGHLLLFLLLRHNAAQHFLEVIGQFFRRISCQDTLETLVLFSHFDFDFPVVHLVGANIFKHLLAAVGLRFFELLRFFRRIVVIIVAAEEDVHRVLDLFLDGFLGPEDLKDALVGFFFRLFFIALAFLFLDHADGVGHEVADHLFDVATDIADFRIFRRFDFDERCADELGQAAGDFCLADTGRADEQDVLGDDFILHVFTQAFAAPAVAQGDGNGFLGFALADDVFIQFRHDLFWRQFCFFHGNTSFLDFFDNDIMVGVDADVGCDVQGLFSDVPGRQVRVLHEGPCRSQGVVAAGTDGQDAVVRFDDFAVAGNEQDALAVCNQEQGFQFVEDLVGPPVLGQFNGTADEVAVVFVQFRFEMVE